MRDPFVAPQETASFDETIRKLLDDVKLIDHHSGFCTVAILSGRPREVRKLFPWPHTTIEDPIVERHMLPLGCSTDDTDDPIGILAPWTGLGTTGGIVRVQGTLHGLRGQRHLPFARTLCIRELTSGEFERIRSSIRELCEPSITRPI